MNEDTMDLETQLILRARHMPDCGDAAEFPWDCTCDYAGFMAGMGVIFTERAARQDTADGEGLSNVTPLSTAEVLR